LHPQLIHERSHELNLFKSYINETKYIGEVGLDASSQYYSSFDLQIEIFTKILSLCSKIGGKILSVHSVRSVKKVLELIEKIWSQQVEL